MQKDGETVGFMISGPELGTLWLYWSYLFPEHRKSGVAMAAMRTFLEHWDNGRFHKVATYTKPGNDVAAAIMKRFGWSHTATLEQHIFGEDYLLYEHKFQKADPRLRPRPQPRPHRAAQAQRRAAVPRRSLAGRSLLEAGFDLESDSRACAAGLPAAQPRGSRRRPRPASTP